MPLQTSGQFGTKDPTITQTAIPGVTPVDNADLNQAAQQNQTAQMAAQAQATSQAAKSGGGDSGIGSILGIGTKLLGGLFGSEGGYLGGFAEGGAVNVHPHGNTALASIAYLIGAHHQQAYGGTPDTLEQATNDIKNHAMEGHANHLATGGAVSVKPNDPSQNTDAALVQQALAQSLGTNVSGSIDQGQVKQIQPDLSTNRMPPVRDDGGAVDPLKHGFMDQGGNNAPYQEDMNSEPGLKRGGYSGYAAGGPPMPSDSDGDEQPLQQGQSFQGDGSVKGPGGPQDDAIPAKLSNGEFVFAQPAVQYFGVDKLVKMNEKGKQGYMQAIGAVQQNQPQQGSPPSPGSPPSQQASAGPPQAPPQPMMQAKGGPATSPTMRRAGFCGM